MRVKCSVMRKYPYPIKDCRNEEEYTFDENASDSVFAWEFLRRNPEYQRDYDKHGSSKRGTEKKRRVLNRWGIFALQDPKADEYPGPSFFTDFPQQVNVPGGDAPKPKGLPSKAEVILRFDLREPAGRQADKVKTILENLRKARKIKLPNPHFHRDLFPLYLKLLDADAQGLKKKEQHYLVDGPARLERLELDGDKADLRKTLTKEITRHLEAAKKIRDKEYSLLLLTGRDTALIDVKIS